MASALYGDMPGAFAPPDAGQHVDYMPSPPAQSAPPEPEPSAPPTMRMLPPPMRMAPPHPVVQSAPLGAVASDLRLPMPSYVSQIERRSVESEQRGHMLGVATIATALGMLAGVRLGGAYGVVAGSLFAGAAVNGYRAASYGSAGGYENRREAVISGTYAVLAALLGGAVVWKTRELRAEKPEMRPNQERRGSSSLTKNVARSCGIRAIV